MPDNSNEGGSDAIRTIDRAGAGIKTQVFQPDVGGGNGNAESLLVRGQLNSANSLPVVLASDQSSLPSRTLNTTSGPVAVSAADTTPAPNAVANGTAPVAGSFAGLLLSGGEGSVAIELTDGAMYYYFEKSYNTTTLSDGNWYPLVMRAQIYATPSQEVLPSCGGSGIAAYVGNPAGARGVRARAWSVGTAGHMVVYASAAQFSTTINNPLNIRDTATVSLSTNAPDPQGSGSITTQNTNPSGTATTGSAASMNIPNGVNTVGVSVTSALTTGVLSAQVLVGSVWSTLAGNVFWNTATQTFSATIPAATTGTWQVAVAGFVAFRVTALATVTGSCSISLDASVAVSGVTVVNVPTVDTELPSATVMANGSATPTAPAVQAFDKTFNNSTWDNVYGNWNTTTGDTGAKTATFAGAMQTNYNARGAALTLIIGAVSGTSPTLTGQVQYTPDGGTTWINIPGAVTTSITAAGAYSLIVYPGSTVVANSVISAPLARNWRVNYTIGGTSPSFTITNVLVAYMN